MPTRAARADRVQAGPTFGAPRRAASPRELSPIAAIYRLQDMATAYRRSVLLLTAHRFGMFEALHAKPRGAAPLARALGIDARATGVLCEALQPLGLLERRGATWRLTALAEMTLVSTSPHYQGDVMGLQVNMFESWAHLPAVVRTGLPAWDLPGHALGWDASDVDGLLHPAASALAPPPRSARARAEMETFIRAMDNIARPRLPEVLPRVPLRGVKRLLDVGCGPATYAIAFAHASPSLEVVAFDRPVAAQIAAGRIAAAGLADRVTTHPGDFLHDSLGRGFDMVFVSNILHGVSRRDGLTVLRKARAALVPGGRLVVQEFVTNPRRTGSAAALFFAVNMMVNTRGGTAYSTSDLTGLLTQARFGRARIVRLDDPSALLIARRP